MLVDARHQALQCVAAGDVDLGKNVMAQHVVQQLAVLVALDAQVVRHVVELPLFLLRHQVVELPRRKDDGDAGVGLHACDRLRHLFAEQAVVV